MKKTSIYLGIVLLLSIGAIFFIFFPEETLKEQKETEDFTRVAGLKQISKGNGIITNIWLSNTEKLTTFEKNNIIYLFVDVGNTLPCGEIETPESEIISFLNFIKNYEKKNNYKFILLAYSEINTNKYDIEDETFQENFIKDYSKLNELGFDGVLIDIEYIPKNLEETYLKIIQDLKSNLPQTATISAYVSGINENANGWEFTPSFLRKISNSIDLIEFGSYDTGINNEIDYTKHLNSQIEILKENNYPTNFIYIFPTHKQFPETIEIASKTYQNAISNYPNNNFLGVGIFAEWTTDEKEWEIFSQLKS